MTRGHVVPQERWYALQTKSQQEDRATANLTAWGLETLAPKLREVCARTTAAPAYRSVPLFPRYIFARFDASTLYAKVRLTRGVERIVGFGECATPIDDVAIALIRSRMQADGFVRLDPPRRGDAVEIVSGPFRALHGVFDRELRGSDRVLILLTSMGSAIRVQVAKASIRTAVRWSAAGCR